MSLTIGRLETRASLPKRWTSLAPVVDRVARGTVGSAFSRELSTLSSAREVVCRIRTLRVRVCVPAKELTEETLTKRWAQAFSRALTNALDRTDGRIEIVRAESRAAWLADYLTRRTSGDVPSGWAYDEFHHLNGLSLGGAIASLVEEWPQAALEICALMDRDGTLERLLHAIDEAHCARLNGVIDRADPHPKRGWSVDDLALFASRLLDRRARGPDTWALAAPARALTVFVRQGQPSSGETGHFAVGDILTMLHILDHLCGIRRVTTDEEFQRALAQILPRLPHLTIDGLRVTLAHIAPVGTSAQKVPLSDTGRRLAAFVDALRTAIPSSGASIARDLTGHWIDSAAAALFLLVPIVQGSRWPERLSASRVWHDYGPRALTYTLAGTAMALARVTLDNLERVDRGLSLFCGWTGEPDLSGLRRYLTLTSDEVRREVLEVLLDEEERNNAAQAASWDTTFGCLAAHLVREFARRLRGFRHSSDEFIVRNFLNLPGRVRVDHDHLRVLLFRNPLWVAAHLSGADTRIDRVPWLGDRSIDFELEGL